jgi:foldase protein PrsA
MHRRFSIWVATTIILLAVILGYGLWQWQENTVAVVGKQRITKSEFYKELEAGAGAEVLEGLITQAVIRQAAAAQGLNPSKSDVDAELELVRQQFPDAASFQAALQQSGMTEEDLRENIFTSLALENLATQGVSASNEEVEDYYQAHKEEFGQPEQVRARHILVDTKQEADNIRAKLDSGADFATLALQYSKDQQTKNRGGDLGYFTKGEMMREFEEAAFALQPGETSDPVETLYGYHIIRVEDHKQAVIPPLGDVRNEVERAVKRQKARPLEEVLQELRAGVDVDVRWERYQMLE